MEKKRDLFPSEKRFLKTSESFRKEQAKSVFHELLQAQTRVDLLRTEAAKPDAKGYQTDKPAIEKAQKEMMKIAGQVKEGGGEFGREVFGQIDKRLNEFAERTLRLAEKPVGEAKFDLEQIEKQAQRTESVREFLIEQLGTTGESSEVPPAGERPPA